MFAKLRTARDYLWQRLGMLLGPLLSLNDPQWGRRPGGGQGPPDLEELWRNFNRKLEGLLGRRGGGDAQGPVGPRSRGGIGLLAVLAVVVWLASGFYIVPEGQ